MKYLQRYLSLLFALVMCVGLFSITAHAEDIDDDYVYVQTQAVFGDDVTSYEQMSYPQNGTIENQTIYRTALSGTDDNYVTHQFHVAKNDKSHIAVADREVTFRLENIPVRLDWRTEIGTTWYSYWFANQWSVAVYYIDGSIEYISNYSCTRADGVYDLTFTFVPKKDVQRLYVTAKSDLSTDNTFNKIVVMNDVPYRVALYVGEMDERSFIFSVEQDTKETGLLNGILGKLTDGFSALGEKLSSVVNGILELPQKLWDLISNGLQALFVPTADDMEEYKDKWDVLLESRLGAVYQVCDVVTGSWDGVMNADEVNTIEFPSATINLPGDAQFTFGGYDVKIVPDGFEFLVTAIKTIVGIVCTLAFINGMLKRYDEVMGVEQ